MTEQEALEILNRDDVSMRRGFFCINDFLAIEVCKKSLEKQIPKKPLEQKTRIGLSCCGEESFDITHKCPSCGSFAILEYCAKCGQKLDWGNEDAE